MEQIFGFVNCADTVIYILIPYYRKLTMQFINAILHENSR